MKYVHLLICLLFVSFAIVQWNDPDPYFWILLYGLIALIAGLAAFEKYNLWLLLGTMAVTLYELFKLFPGFSAWISDGMPSIVESMKASSPYIEVVREFLGLAVALLVVLYFYIRYRKSTMVQSQT